MTENIEGGRPRDRVRPGLAWLGAWLAMLAVPLWTTHLSAAWLILAGAGAVLWTAGVVGNPGRMSAAAAVALWVTLGLTAGVQYRLGEVAGEWPRLQRQIEESGAAALNSSLDELVERGERAAVSMEAALAPAEAGVASEALFARLEEVRRTEGVSALAIFDQRGVPLAWAGEHRGAIPLSARLARQAYVYHEGPLFSYVYFTRPVSDGRTAIATVLLESRLNDGSDDAPFAQEFTRRTGLTPRFFMPGRALGTSVWDWSTDRTILSVDFAALSQQHWWERVVERGRHAAGLGWVAALVLLGATWYNRRRGRPGVPVAIATAGLVAAPVGEMVGTAKLFSPLQFVLPLPADITLGMLLILLIGISVWVLTRRVRRPPLVVPWPGQALVALLIFPSVLILIGRSATPGLLASSPAGGLALQLAAALLVALPLFFLLRASPAADLGRREAVLLFGSGIALALLLALVRVVSWSPGQPPSPWPAALWVVPYLLVCVSGPALFGARGALRSWLIAGLIATSTTLPHLWIMHSAAELENAELDLARLGTEPDPFLDFLLRQFADAARRFAEQGESGVNLLYHSWVESGLAAEGHEAHLTIWRNAREETQLALSGADTLPSVVHDLVGEIGAAAAPSVRMFDDVESLHYLLLAPLPDGRLVTVAVPPRTRMGRATALARFLHPRKPHEATAYNKTLYLVPAAPSDTMVHGTEGPTDVHWTRTDAGWRSEARAHFPDGWMHAHLFVRTPTLPLLFVRAALAVVATLAMLLGLWLLARLLCGDFGVRRRFRHEWLRSFRGRLTMALFLFFLFPTAIFGAVAYGAVAREVVLSAAAQAHRALEQASPAVLRERLPEVGSEIGTDLLLYQHGLLVGAAAPEILDLGLFHSWLSPSVFLDFASGEDTEAQENRRLGESEYLVAYRRLDPERVLAAPIPLASQEITRRQREFRDIALLVSLLGAALSIILSLLVARALSRPLAQLSHAAVTVGGGDLRVRLPEREDDEFGSVYQSFNQMVQRLRRARVDLAREARRTETIVAEAATGVLALDGRGRVELVNPRAAEILGGAPVPGEPLPDEGPLLVAIKDALREFRRSNDAEAGRELEIDSRIVRLRLRKLASAEGPRGMVVALEDVTSEVRTARVLAWGEMARQVAHEIKNPLTPIKLSVQHLRRAYADRRSDFAEILDRNVEAVLEEIDRLSEIARAFARFGAPQHAEVGLEEVDVAASLRETLALYRSGGPAGIRLAVDAPTDVPLLAIARAGELKEVLINLLENAREALDGSGVVRVSVARDEERGCVEIVVADTGEGIRPDLLSRIFEPHFSTRTSGTGLGLAIVKRIVESWGGSIEAESTPGTGTRMRVRLKAVTSSGNGSCYPSGEQVD